VGYLEVRRRKAKKLSDTRILPPQNVVAFTLEEILDASSVVSLLTAEGMPREEAHSIYDSWLADARNEDGDIRIDGVGEIRDGRVLVAAPLHNAINPEKEEIITMEKQQTKQNGGGSIWAWVLVGILLAVLVVGVLWACKRGFFDGMCDRDSRTEEIEIMTIVDPAAEPVAEPAAACTEKAVEPATASPDAAESPTDGHYHVIAGAFAIQSNADKLVKKIKAEYPELNPAKIVQPSTGYWLVSIYSAQTEREAYNTMHKYWDIDLYMWVHHSK
jgi:hypothetical protein